MAGGPIQLWNAWATQILVVLSFSLQTFLFLFARTRRHGPFAVLRILLWLAYLMADSTAVYTLGHLSINGSPQGQKLAVFWAPFLLVHLGGQDTITAYALEDNKLWPRHLLNLSVQSFGVAYVLYKHITEIPTTLGLATGLMFVIGLIKYGERIWALKCATLGSILSSIRKPKLFPTYYSALPPRGPRAEERDEEELLLFAQAMLPLCKGAMANFPVALCNPYIWNWNWKATVKVVEMELSLMYDIVYTKAAVIHNCYGYCIRVFSPLATIIAFTLFQLSANEDVYSRVDVAITYVLLVGAFLLDMASAFSALGSSWTCNLLWDRGWSRLGLVILSLRRHVKLARGHRRWSGSIGQFNLLHFCCRDKTKLSSRVVKMIGLKDWWNKWHYSETLVISENAKGLVFQHVWQTLKEIHDPGAKDETQSPPYKEGMEEPIAMMPTETDHTGFCPELYEDTVTRRVKLPEALGFGGELQEVMLTLHICMDVFLLCTGTPKGKNAAASTYLEAIKVLSNYMVFLIAIHPDPIPGLELRSLYETTRDALYQVCSTFIENKYPKREEKLARHMQNRGVNIGGQANAILSRGNFYASMLLGLVDRSKAERCGIMSRYERDNGAGMDKLRRLMPDLELSCRDGVFDMPKVLALILDTWVRLLIFTSVRCNRDAHARQINCGGQLTTVIWLMAEHAHVLFLKPPG